MSDNEDSTAALGHSEILSVKHPVGATIPEFCQGGQEPSEVRASIASGAKDTGDVLPNEPAGIISGKDAEIDKGKVAARVIHSLSESGD